MRRLHRKKAAKCRCDNREHNHGELTAEALPELPQEAPTDESGGDDHGENESQ